MRIFVSHRLDDESNHLVEPTATVAPPPKPLGGKDFGALLSAAAAHHVLPKKKSTRKWTLVIEGGLLINQLDHESAREVDRRWDSSLPLLGNVIEKDAGYSARAKKIVQSEPLELNQTVKPLLFTHLFDKVEVEMKAVKSSDVEDAAASSAEGTNNAQMVKTFNWERLKSNTPDSHAFFIVYNEEGRVPLTDPNENERNESSQAEYDSDFISAQVKLYRSKGKQEMYAPSDQLCEVLFPTFIGKKPISQNKKRKSQDMTNEVTAVAPKDIVIPNLLTMDEALFAIFNYIRTNNLHDPTDLSIINFDDPLTGLFGTNRMLMAELRKSLLERGLLVKVEPGTHPIILNYKMTKEGAESLVEEKTNTTNSTHDASAVSTQSNSETVTRTRSSNDAGKGKYEPAGKGGPEEPHIQTMLSCDLDIEIPNIYHLRARDILRKINHREHEYTSCRNKAKNALVATNISEEIAKQAVDDTVTGSNLTPDVKQVWMALANGAHEGGEAQHAALIELRTTSLMGQLEERVESARKYWEVVNACRSIGDANSA